MHFNHGMVVGAGCAAICVLESKNRKQERRLFFPTAGAAAVVASALDASSGTSRCRDVGSGGEVMALVWAGHGNSLAR
eukprot:15086419-Alexandrium_andersonii.AAC.1